MTSPAEPKIVVVTGATAVGKTAVALALAERFPVALVSLDSAMVYRGMDIGTAKPEPEVLARFPHALVDIRDPLESYNVADFLRDADAAVRGALANGRIPVLVGGTMLYLKAFREGLSAMPGADREFRAQLRLEAADVGWEALFDRLAAVDPVAAAKIHPNNAPRIERALEVFVLTGQPISRFWESGARQSAQQRLGAELVEFAIHPADRAALHARVEQRLDAMLEAGFVSEVAGLRARGDLTCGLPALRAVGYRQIWEHLEGGSSESRMRDRVLAATRQFAKRQLTWLRGWRLEALEWGDPARIAGRIAVSARLAIS